MVSDQNRDLLEILRHVDPAQLDYQEWCSVGMALKDAGFTASDWDSWSKSDASRHHDGECFRKWDTFHGSSKPVKSGTIVQLAMDQGWTPPEKEGYALDWDAAIGGKDDLVILDKAWVEGREVSEPAEWKPADQLIKYIETLFESGENVGYVTESWHDDEKDINVPTKGHWDRTAGQLIERLRKCGGDIGAVLGDYNPEYGAWIRFNPLDGKGCKNENVAEYRYALVESDKTDIDKQNAILRELRLPIACLTHSGKKSLHAIVRIEAGDYDEYRKRVDYLYDVCKKNGLEVDKQNKNPSRLSRMPGVMRSGRKQYLIDTNLGEPSWDSWREWFEGVNDDLPDPENLAAIWNNLPPLADCLIDNVLRKGHKMLLAGPSKAGKSFLLCHLCCAIAEGMKWLSWPCAKGRVMYINLELDRASCLHRFADIYKALGWEPRNIGNIDIWNLRGKAIPMDKLAPKLIRRAVKIGYTAIVIDPIYKVITGDENSADQMANFCNQFDKVCTELDCAVIYCHHHSKGMQGQKRSMDRASGSGVFARDPDTLLDFIQLETTDALIKQEENKAVCAACIAALEGHVPAWEQGVSQDDQRSEKVMLEACLKRLKPDEYRELGIEIAAVRESVRKRSAWRIEGTLREFPRFDPVNLWFDYPIHYVDNVGSLKDIDAEGSAPPWQKGSSSNKKHAMKRKETKLEKIENALQMSDLDGKATTSKLAEYFSVTPSTVRKWIAEYQEDLFIDKNDGVVKKKVR